MEPLTASLLISYANLLDPNCFDFSLATKGGYQLGACFYPTRS